MFLFLENYIHENIRLYEYLPFESSDGSAHLRSVVLFNSFDLGQSSQIHISRTVFQFDGISFLNGPLDFRIKLVLS